MTQEISIHQRTGRLCSWSREFADLTVLPDPAPYILSSSWCRIEQLGCWLTYTASPTIIHCHTSCRLPHLFCRKILSGVMFQDGEQINWLVLQKQRQTELWCVRSAHPGSLKHEQLGILSRDSKLALCCLTKALLLKEIHTKQLGCWIFISKAESHVLAIRFFFMLCCSWDSAGPSENLLMSTKGLEENLLRAFKSNAWETAAHHRDMRGTFTGKKLCCSSIKHPISWSTISQKSSMCLRTGDPQGDYKGARGVSIDWTW